MSDGQTIVAADALAEAVRRVIVGGTTDHLWDEMERAWVAYKQARGQLSGVQLEAVRKVLP